jgi:hypothetical protein
MSEANTWIQADVQPMAKELSSMSALPLTCLPASSPRKDGERRQAATLAIPSPRSPRGEGKGEGHFQPVFGYRT